MCPFQAKKNRRGGRLVADAVDARRSRPPLHVELHAVQAELLVEHGAVAGHVGAARSRRGGHGGALAVRREYHVLEEAVYDALVAASAPGYLQPTTAGRTLDVSAGGEAGVDWANIGSPTTTVNLSGTTVKTATDVEAETTSIINDYLTDPTYGLAAIQTQTAAIEGDTQNIQSRIPAALGANGNIKADVRDFNGTAGTFASGIPAVNTTQVAGTSQTAFDMSGRIQTALPNAAPAASGGLFTRGTGAGQINQAVNGTIDVNVTYFGNVAGTFTGGKPDVILANAFHGGAAAQIQLATFTVATNAVAWASAWDAEVQSEVQDALEANNLDHLVKIAVDTDFATTVHLNSVVGYLADNGTAATYDRTTDSQEAIRDRGDAAWVTGGGGSLTAGEIADAVWDEATSGHQTAGTTGKAITDAQSAGDPWATALPASYTAGQAGYIVGNAIPEITDAITGDQGLEEPLENDFMGHAHAPGTGQPGAPPGWVRWMMALAPPRRTVLITGRLSSAADFNRDECRPSAKQADSSMSAR